MKKIRSCQLLKTVCLGILGGLLIMGLAGCSVNKNSRAYLEGKAAELERVFPTENLEDLFEEFPGGFKLGSYYLKIENDKEAISQTMEIYGNSTTNEISGVIKDIKATDNPSYKEEILKESKFKYVNNEFIFDSDNFTAKDLETRDFLINQMAIDSKKLTELKLLSKSYSMDTGSGNLRYQLKDRKISQFLNYKDNPTLEMIIDIDYPTIHENKYEYSVTLQTKKDLKYIISFKGYETLGEENEE
ncbi:hypothetical protein AB1395_03570 [Streptococcus pluranimalium]|uniref:hypothetical protein n=1 Tax=Streptococcus pluranimalium TaxID=82348 RepID=UPI0034666D09